MLPNARSVVMIEQVVGLMYVAIVISRVVGLTVARQRLDLPGHAGARPQPAATSGVIARDRAKGGLEGSRTWAVSPGASRRSTRRRSVTDPWSTNRSPGIPMTRTATSR